MTRRRVLPGSPAPLGMTLADGGANIAVFSQYATGIDLCLFDADGARELERIPLPERTGSVFHALIPGLTAGTRYGLRAHGPYAPREGHRFNPAKLLVDPYAKALDRPFTLHDALRGEDPDGSANDRDSAAFVPKAILLDATTTNTPRRTRRPATSWEDSILYEVHVRGFTKRHPDVPVALRGTCAGFAHPASLAHFVKLGITAVELMPVAAAVDEPHLARHSLVNYWGYNTVGWMVPDPRLAPGGPVEFRAMVDAFHEAGIEVLLDVVLNHSGEGDAKGPTLSLRGLDNATYYRLVDGDAARYVNDTGTGNTLALDREPVMRLALDTLRHWATAAGVDGFRYDLATTLGRRAGGFDREAPLLAAIGADPVLRALKHIAEPWDVGPGGYRLGDFPADWAEWNDRYRDRVRHFWRGDGEHVGEMATRVVGSPDLFAERFRPPSRSVNFVTAHDGFTLRDLVSYEKKHNEANGEGNRDGTNANASWNHGVEGETADETIVNARERDVRALLATLLLSRGTPMLNGGDELGRTQRGNNNAYAQDNGVTWFDWDGADRALIDFTAALVAARKRFPALRDHDWLTGRARGLGARDIEWRRPDGAEMSYEDWSSGRVRSLVMLLADRDDARILVVIHGGGDDVQVTLPEVRAGHRWHWLIGTQAVEQVEVAMAAGERPIVAGRSVALFAESADAPRTGVASHAVAAHHTSTSPSGGAAAGAPPPMTFPRTAGVLLHPTSLPGRHGIGSLGFEAQKFIAFLRGTGVKLWQVLPIGPTGYGDSPYQCFSAFAGNPLLVALPDETMPEEAFAHSGDVSRVLSELFRPASAFGAHQVDWGPVIADKQRLLRIATQTLEPDDRYRLFCSDNGWWLEDYALFMALKQAHGGAPWTDWEEGARRREPAALERWRTQLADEVEHHRRVQHLFFGDWKGVRHACALGGIKLMGDLPIYVAHDSADVWADQQYFKLDERGRPRVVAGVPPDYFSATGQLWGNPIYDWDAMRADGFAWWIRRMKAMFANFDVVRIDHFRGFESYWEVPGGDTTAVNGRWVKAPGDELFTAITKALGPLPIVAEDLGVITDEVKALRDKFAYPGMAILQFAFGADGSANDFQPHTYPREKVVYTGTHDNDTTMGWWESTPGGDSTRTQEMIDKERAFAMRYLGTDGREMHWTMIRAVLASVAHTAIIPMQDLLGLGSEARMNLPGRQGGNWGWRFTWDQLGDDVGRRLHEMVTLYQR